MAVGRTPISIENVQRLALVGQVAEVELGVADRRDAGVVDRACTYQPASARADGLVEHGLAARPAGCTTGGGTLPLRKPGMRSSRPSARAARCDALLDLGGGDLGLDADARLGQLGDARLDG